MVPRNRYFRSARAHDNRIDNSPRSASCKKTGDTTSHREREDYLLAKDSLGKDSWFTRALEKGEDKAILHTMRSWGGHVTVSVSPLRRPAAPSEPHTGACETVNYYFLFQQALTISTIKPLKQYHLQYFCKGLEITSLWKAPHKNKCDSALPRTHLFLAFDCRLYDFYLTHCGGHNEKETLSDILLNMLST